MTTAVIPSLPQRPRRRKETHELGSPSWKILSFIANRIVQIRGPARLGPPFVPRRAASSPSPKRPHPQALRDPQDSLPSAFGPPSPSPHPRTSLLPEVCGFPPPLHGTTQLPPWPELRGGPWLPKPRPAPEEGAGTGQESVTKFPWQPRGAISSLSTGFGTCPLAAISMATRSGSSLGKRDTSFHDDERVGRAKLEESHHSHRWASIPSHPIPSHPSPPHPTPPQVRRGGAAQYSKAREPGSGAVQTGRLPALSQSKLVLAPHTPAPPGPRFPRFK